MSSITAWPIQAEIWLDARGKGAWIAAMVLGFIFFWPVGLAILAYMIWSKRMFSKSCATRHDGKSWTDRRFSHGGMRSSGNTAFDAYKADTIERLQHEQEEFEAFLSRLRESKDKAEFDQYMEDRARAAREAGSDAGDEADDTPDEPPAKPAKRGTGAY